MGASLKSAGNASICITLGWKEYWFRIRPDINEYEASYKLKSQLTVYCALWLLLLLLLLGSVGKDFRGSVHS